VLGDLAWSYKVDGEAARALARRRPEAVRHTVALTGTEVAAGGGRCRGKRCGMALLDGGEREAGGFACRSAMRRGKQKWAWPQRREDRGVLRWWVAHVGTENHGAVGTHWR
jgi:hypothetical protein